MYKILIVLTPPFDPNTGGVQMSTYKMADYFVSKGMDVSIYSFNKEGHIQQDFAILYHSIEKGRNQNPRNLFHFNEVVKALKPNFVINQMPYEKEITLTLFDLKSQINFILLGCLRNSLFSVKSNIETYRKRILPKILQKIFSSSLGDSILLQIHKKRHSNDLKFILDHYDCFILFGPPNKTEIEYFIGDYKKEKLAFIPNSIPSVSDRVPPKYKTLLYLGRVGVTQKRSDLLIPLWERIYRQLPDWEFVIVGSGSGIEDIKGYIEKSNLPRVSLKGKQKPDEFYQKASIFIMTSSFEGFPNTLIEAQSYGVIPVIFDSYPVASWVIQDRFNGILINPFNVDLMANRIIELAKSEEQLKFMAENALENARKFTIDKVGDMWMELFEELYQKY